ncbi:metalloprotease mep1 [Diaporthe amygdali]|uniref:metalloprotease mep1 n=1 Tax=Phomopsis amygdali TaxID=1214568 RepID=UPI0022FECD36|nr:metalloprotease mep1 [Diaporthe amygdali]KAJ0120080.1 metalloprotease mep1 [Diaporthe amygdali]
MKLGALLVNSACLAFVSQAAANEKCGSSEPEPEALQAAAKLRDAQRAEGTPSRAALQRRDEGLLITTYVHVVEDQQHAGFVTDKMIDDQMTVLNETYAPHNIQFTVANVSHTVNDAWTAQARIREKALALRRGGYDALNLYLDTGLMTNAGSATGLCSFPVEDPAGTGINGTSWAIYDGCFVSPGTMPGGPGVPWEPADNKGKTATHEVGHWLGLFHVFDGFDCAGDGEFVDDTPATQVATVGCPTSQDSCPDQPGLDPIHNYMDYASHDCITEFTPLQEERMYRSFNTLRRGK